MEVLEEFLARHPRLWRVYVAWNFCKPALADGREKNPSRGYDWFYRIFYLNCSCCAALRGLLVGGFLGLACGWLVWG